jgi:O-acetylserine/cysteine efflux transporter
MVRNLLLLLLVQELLLLLVHELLVLLMECLLLLLLPLLPGGARRTLVLLLLALRRGGRLLEGGHVLGRRLVGLTRAWLRVERLQGLGRAAWRRALLGDDQLLKGVRFAVALLFLFAFIKPPFPDPKRLLVILLLIGPLNAGLIYLGFSMVNSLSAFIVSLQLWVPFTALFAWLILGEAMVGLQLLGLIVAFGGIAWMTLSPGTQGDIPGILVGVAASICWALGTILVRQVPSIKPLKLQGMTALLSTPLMFAVAFGTEKDNVPAVVAAPMMVWVCVFWAAVL